MNLFEKKDSNFDNFRKSIDARMKELAADGIGTHIKEKDPILPDDEKRFWDIDVFSLEKAEGLSNAVFSLIASHLASVELRNTAIWKLNDFLFLPI